MKIKIENAEETIEKLLKLMVIVEEFMFLPHR